MAYLLRYNPGADPKLLWSDLGYLLNRWAYWRVRDAVYLHRNIALASAALQRQPAILHLPKKRAA